MGSPLRPGRRTVLYGEKNPPGSGVPLGDAPGDTGVCVRETAEAALGTNRGQVTWREQRNPCKETDAERGRGRWCSRLERGRLRAAWGAAAEPAGRQWVSASGKLCRTTGGLCRRLGAACLCAQPAETCRGSSSCSLEMPAGRGAGEGDSGDPPNCGKMWISSGF